MISVEYCDENGIRTKEIFYRENSVTREESQRMMQEYDMVIFHNSSLRNIWEDSLLSGLDENHEFDTFWIDLSMSEEELYGSMRKNTRYEVKRAAERDNCTFKVIMDNSEDKVTSIHEMLQYSTDNLRQKGHLWRLSAIRIQAWMENSAFLITKAVSGLDGHTVAVHGYICDRRMKIARLHISASDFRETADKQYRAMAGRVNRWLHWEDIKELKRQGFLYYDVGGISLGADVTEEYRRVNEFKYGLCDEAHRIVKKYAAQTINIRQIREINQKMKSLYPLFDRKKCVIYGYGITGRVIRRWLEENGILLAGIIDNSLYETDNGIMGGSYLKELNVQEHVIIIASSAWAVIEKECEAAGFVKRKSMISVKDAC